MILGTAGNAAEIETERLALRRHRVEDFADCLGMWGDPETTRFIGGTPFSEEEVWQRLLRYAGLWALLGFGYWVLRERDGGRFVGEAGLGDFRRAVVPALGNAPELGFALAPWAWGQGYATEAAQAVVSWADRRLKAPRLVAMVDHDNAASVRVVAKCGFRAEAAAVYKGKDVTIYAR